VWFDLKYRLTVKGISMKIDSWLLVMGELKMVELHLISMKQKYNFNTTKNETSKKELMFSQFYENKKSQNEGKYLGKEIRKQGAFYFALVSLTLIKKRNRRVGKV
jgi:hypothetical protein